MTPPNAWLEQGAALAFSAAAVDQFAHVIAGTPAVTWSATGGTIASNGQFTAGGTAGTFAVTASGASGAGGAHGDAVVTVTAGFAATINVAPSQSGSFGNALSDSGLPFANRGNPLRGPADTSAAKGLSLLRPATPAIFPGPATKPTGIPSTAGSASTVNIRKIGRTTRPARGTAATNATNCGSVSKCCNCDPKARVSQIRIASHPRPRGTTGRTTPPAGAFCPPDLRGAGSLPANHTP